MDSKELRIGNFIEKFFEGNSIGIIECTLRDIWDVKADSTGKFQYKPVRLTNDLLKELGASEVDVDSKSLWGQFEIESPTMKGRCQYLTITGNGCSLLGESSESEIDLRHIDYAHQLQNLYYTLANKKLIKTK